jgi:hypothetical protein
MKARISCFVLFAAAALLSATVAHSQPLAHPGILHHDDDLTRIRTKVAQKAQPWWDGYQKFANDPRSSHSYKMNGPYAEVMRMTPVPGVS